jgi:hypothetical protein
MKSNRYPIAGGDKSAGKAPKIRMPSAETTRTHGSPLIRGNSQMNRDCVGLRGGAVRITTTVVYQ